MINPLQYVIKDVLKRDYTLNATIRMIEFSAPRQTNSNVLSTFAKSCSPSEHGKFQKWYRCLQKQITYSEQKIE